MHHYNSEERVPDLEWSFESVGINIKMIIGKITTIGKGMKRKSL